MRELSETEEYQASHLWNLLDDLRTFTIEFEAAVRILDFCYASLLSTQAEDQADEHWLWVMGQHVPARDAALTVYQFGWTLITSIPGTLRRCPTVFALADHAALKAARREFKERMGDYTLLRHAVGHRAELRQTIEKKQSNSARNRSTGHGEIYWGTMEDRALVFTIDGKRVSLPITMATHAHLVEFTLRTFAAFPEADPAYGR